MGRIRKLASDIKWRLKPVRWAGKALYGVAGLARLGRRPRAARGVPHPTMAALQLHERLVREGYVKLPHRVPVPELDLGSLAGSAAGKSFIDVWDRFPEAAGDVFSRIVNDPELSAIVLRYFNGRPWLWHAGLNYSDPSQGLTDSQMWHFDYGDLRQLHIMVYLSKVDVNCGPFTFLRSELSDRVKRHPLLIERLTDADMGDRYGIKLPGQATQLTGEPGDVFLNDPGRLMHQGARCSQPRLVMFISFTTPAPMSKGGSSTMSRERRASLVRARQAGAAAGSLPDDVFL